MDDFEHRVHVDSGRVRYPGQEAIARLRAEVEALRADAETKRGLLLWALYHAQGGSSPVGQPIRRHLGIERHAHLTPEQIKDAARAAQGGKHDR